MIDSQTTYCLGSGNSCPQLPCERCNRSLQPFDRDGLVDPRVKPEDGHDGVGDETDHHKIANKPNAPISMIKAATVIAIGRIAL